MTLSDGYDYKKDAYKTVRLLEIGGRYYVLQQEYRLYYYASSTRKTEAGVALEKMPRDNHRLIPLEELVDMEGIADDVLGADPVDSMEEL